MCFTNLNVFYKFDIYFQSITLLGRAIGYTINLRVLNHVHELEHLHVLN
jgi:hypothetical protein